MGKKSKKSKSAAKPAAKPAAAKAAAAKAAAAKAAAAKKAAAVAAAAAAGFGGWARSTLLMMGAEVEAEKLPMVVDLVEAGMRSMNLALMLGKGDDLEALVEDIWVNKKACATFHQGLGGRGSAYFSSDLMYDRTFGILMENETMGNLIAEVLEQYAQEKGWDKAIATRCWLQKAATEEEVEKYCSKNNSSRLHGDGKHDVHGDSFDNRSTARVTLGIGKSFQNDGKTMGFVDNEEEEEVEFSMAHGTLLVMEKKVAGADDEHPRYQHWVKDAGGTFLIVFEFGDGSNGGDGLLEEWRARCEKEETSNN